VIATAEVASNIHLTIRHNNDGNIANSSFNGG
jgi:hypothetical protein